MDTFTRDGLTFDVLDRGPRAGVPVLLLHGFPQDATAYDDVAPLLHVDGFRTLAPDQRGYSPGARPEGRRAYALAELVADAVALLDAAGADRAHVVGHDWGGAVAWALAGRHPERVRSLTAVSTPHPAAARHAALRGSQALRSLYMLAFQVPALPERTLLADGGLRLREALVGTGLADAWADHYVARMREPGALTAALTWYRALAVAPPLHVGRARVPTTHVYGAEDRFFAPRAAAVTGRYVAAPFHSVPLAAGHWIPETRPDAVADAVVSMT